MPTGRASSTRVLARALPSLSRPTRGLATESPALTPAAASLSLLLSRIHRRGHLVADLDPLSPSPLRKNGRRLSSPFEPKLSQLLNQWPEGEYSLKALHPEVDWDECRVVNLPSTIWRFKPTTTREMLDTFVRCHCGTLSVETDALISYEEKRWLRERVETEYDSARRRLKSTEVEEQVLSAGGHTRWHPFRLKQTPEELKRVVEGLVDATYLEKMLAKYYPSAKRFGIEGAESFIPGLQELIQHSAAGPGKVRNVIIGMSHRGRLNVLANVLGKQLASIASEFDQDNTGKSERYDEWAQIGDVKYHLGTSATLETRAGVPVTATLMANPSHLEIAGPLAQGFGRAVADRLDEDECGAMPIIVHGDASFCGQGIVAESIAMSSLESFSTSGCIRIVLNNRIGFTTEPSSYRPGPHCTDFAKLGSIPVIHVNGDDVSAVCLAMRMASDFRAEFRKDVVVDLVCYRRHGHNELDDPMLTQPVLYKKIAKHPPPLEVFINWCEASSRLPGARHIAEQRAQKMERKWQEARDECGADPLDWIKGNWLCTSVKIIDPEFFKLVHPDTGVSRDELEAAAKKSFDCSPAMQEGFCPHDKVQKLLQKRLKNVLGGKKLDWATAEGLAFGTLVNRGLSVRLSGQDVQRGTFNHRHAVITCQETGEKTSLLGRHAPDGVRFDVMNSHLSEAAVLSFEYGFSLCSESDRTLTIWEAQFGDFVNCAQAQIDTLIASGEAKWDNASRLVMSLPHGLDGQGPEHSSCRIERFLQLSSGDLGGSAANSIWENEDIVKGFRAVDRDGSGSIDREEALRLAKSLVPHSNPQIADELISRMDFNNDGFISMDEWTLFMTHVREDTLDMQHNWTVALPSTPAQLFHLLLRQVRRGFAKPLVLVSPKFLLHHGACQSPVEDFLTGNRFHRVLHDPVLTEAGRMSVGRVVLCSGQMFYHLNAARRRLGSQNVALIRVEELSPFPFRSLREAIALYSADAEICWVQEEPHNMGAWTHVQPRIALALGKSAECIKYIGRPPSCSPADGNYQAHRLTSNRILEEALNV